MRVLEIKMFVCMQRLVELLVLLSPPFAAWSMAGYWLRILRLYFANYVHEWATPRKWFAHRRRRVFFAFSDLPLATS
jgi:hypothetical protein